MMKCNVMTNGEYISELYRWYTEKTLFVNRRYQRKLVWTLSEKQQFIDTLLKGYPVPLFILAKPSQNNNKEIIDGLQRLEAIMSFILNRFPVHVDGVDQYFNLDAYPGNAPLIRSDILQQKRPVMSMEMSHDFLLYKLPISIIEANDVVIDDAFKRINSTGRKLSPQDLRQAGVVSKFSDLVRTIATHLRGDATEDVIEMNEIADYSLSSFGLDYGLPIKDIFWVEQGILSEDALRRSKDEEIIAILCNCILNGDDCGMSVNTINQLYNTQSKNYKQNELALTESKCQEMIELFQRVLNNMEKIFEVTNTTFSQHLFFNKAKNYNKDIVFIVIFLTFARLYSENYYIVDYQGMNTILNGIADKELNDIIAKSECQWNAKVRTHLIERVKNVLVPYMEFQEQDPKWNQIFINFMKQVCTEGQMYDFKIGLHDLRSGEENSTVISKCVKTLTAMANTRPRKEGVIVVGISDKERDARDYERYYSVHVPRYNEYYVPGVKEEAIRFYGSIQNFTKAIKDHIEKEAVRPEVIQYILTNMDTLKYNNQILVVLKLKSDKPLFYGNEMFIRYESHNKAVSVASDEYYAVLDSFK